ncbi:MAG TPA: hypothetical protein VK982_05990 [Bacteroidales bacterium]|nr:hypothetical protein [Bacteroidales bacterium]
MNYIEIDKNMIPYRFDMTIKRETYTFQVNYNALKDFFTIDLYKNDEVIVLGEKLVYGKPLFMTARHKDIPKTIIIPYDMSENTDRITFENMNKDVFLFLIGDENETLD